MIDTPASVGSLGYPPQYKYRTHNQINLIMIIEQGTSVFLSKKGNHIVRQTSQLNLTKGQESSDNVTQLVKTVGLTPEQQKQVIQLMKDDKLTFNSTIES